MATSSRGGRFGLALLGALLLGGALAAAAFAGLYVEFKNTPTFALFPYEPEDGLPRAAHARAPGAPAAEFAQTGDDLERARARNEAVMVVSAVAAAVGGLAALVLLWHASA